MEHARGAWSARLAARPDCVAFAADSERAVAELSLYLEEHFRRLPARAIYDHVVPEEATLEHYSVALQPPVTQLTGAYAKRRISTTEVDFDVISIQAAGGAKWMMVPVLCHIFYLSVEDVERPDEAVSRELQRRVAAAEVDGASFLDLLPPHAIELRRIQVWVDRQLEQAGTEALKVDHEAASKLLASIGRRVEPNREPPRHRERELGLLRISLEGVTRASVVVVGSEGSGKSTLLRAVLGAPEFPHPVFATSGAELVAGQSGFGQLEERLLQVAEAASALDAVLYFEQLDDVFAGKPGSHEEMAALLLRFVDEGRLRLVGEMSPEAYDRLRLHHSSFFAALQRLNCEGLSPEQSLDVIRAESTSRAARGEPSLALGVDELLIALLDRYEPYRALPGKAVAFFNEMSAARRAEPREDGSLLMDRDDAYRCLSLRSGVPELLLREDRRMRIQEVQSFLHRFLVGQTEAVRFVAETVCSVKAGLQPASKPIASFLFVGPTGVGKTELAKALARFLFGSAERMARFDMSEYADPYAAERLIRGTAEQDGVLTRRVREQPFCVLLLDEIEKADTAVFDLLLQILGDGRLSDARGRVAYFHNCIVIMTSNLGAGRRMTPGLLALKASARAHTLSSVHEHFRPELVNRLDRIVVFEALSTAQILDVAHVTTSRIAAREGLEERSVRLWVSDSALRQTALAGYSEVYGARGLRRHIERELVSPVATLLSELGQSAHGCLVSVEQKPVLGRQELAAQLGERELSTALSQLERGTLVFRTFSRGSRMRTPELGPVLRISNFRRQVRAWQLLAPIQEADERRAEVLARVGGTQAQRRKRRRPQLTSAELQRLLVEHAQLDRLLSPLARERQTLELLEEEAVQATSEGGEAELLLSDALASYAEFQRALVPALLALNTDSEVSLVIHRLKGVHGCALLSLSLLRAARKRGWAAQAHLPRPRTGWAAALAGESFLQKHADISSGNGWERILVRLRGHSAGALLSFLLGRYAYQLEEFEEEGELLVTLAAPRYSVTSEELDESWGSLSASERKVADHLPLHLELVSGSPFIETQQAPRHAIESVFDHWEEIIFDRLIDTVEGGDGFLPSEPEASEGSES